MKRPVTMHAVLLSAALVAAYFVWTRDRRSVSDGDTVAILNLARVDAVHYDSPDRKVEIKRQKDALGAHFWVDIETQEAPRPAFKGRPFPRRPPLRRRPPGPGATGAPGTKAPAPLPGRVVVPAPSGKAAPAAKVGAPSKPLLGKPGKPGEPRKPGKPRKPATSLKQDPKANPDAAKKPKAVTKAPTPAPAKGSTPPKPAPAAAPVPAKPASAPVVPKVKVVAPAPPPQKIRKTKFFKGNKATDELFKLLAHLPALRSLGRLGKTKLEEFGLTQSKATLTVVSGNTRRAFIVGDRTYGNADYYLQDKTDERVYVIRSRPLEDLRYAEFRLMDREIVDLTPGDVEQVVLSAGGKRKTLYQGNRHKPAAAFWSEEPAAKQGKELYRSWLAKVQRLRALEYTRPGQPPKKAEELVRISYVGRRGPLGSVRLLVERTLAPGVVSAAPQGGANYFALSENSRVPVKLSKTLAAEIAKDVDNVLKD